MQVTTPGCLETSPRQNSSNFRQVNPASPRGRYEGAESTGRGTSLPRRGVFARFATAFLPPFLVLRFGDAGLEQAAFASASPEVFAFSRASGHQSNTRELLGMTHYPDGSHCDYFGTAGPIAIGWLEPGFPYSRGDVDGR